ncbi:putative PhzF superfamily epimerase YddE/YHI9 [Desulfitispora alkaliphila]|uniref:hypothetical protein n=1 Tax=Desulfitispora alkaliphila TaxID=622674 RepID=UPI003D203638
MRHATLASAHSLWEEGYLNKDKTAKFYSKSGVLPAGLSNSWIELDFPASEPEAVEVSADIAKALNIKPFIMGKAFTTYLKLNLTH